MLNFNISSCSIFDFHPVSFELEHHTSTTSYYHVFIVCASNSIIHVQRSQLGTCCNRTTPAAGSRLPLQRRDHTDRWLKFQSFFVTLLFPLPLHCVRLRRQTDSPSALLFVIVCASNSIIYVQRSQLGTCWHSTMAAAGSRFALQRPDPTDRWQKNSNLSSSSFCFHFKCTEFGFTAKQEREGRIGISAIGRCDLVVAAAARNPPPPLCCCSMFRVVTSVRE